MWRKVYKTLSQLKNNNQFCTKDCANKYSGRNKLKFICKICGEKFYWSKSRTKDNNPIYCSWECRVKDKEHIFKNAIKGNVAQQNKKGLNRLELAGQKILKEHGNFHCTLKPIALMEYLIKMVTRKGGTVLDPFMGSGSTGVAAKNLGMDFVGIELDEDYIEIAKKRILNI